MKKRLFALLCMITVVASMVTGCVTSFDAAGYVKGYLDSTMKADFDEYAKLCDSEVSEVEKVYNKGIDNNVTSMLTGITVNDETKESIRQALVAVFKNAKYTVGDAKKTDDGFEVSVEVTPLHLGLTTEKCTELAQNALKKFQKENTKSTDTTAYYNMYGQAIASYLNDLAKKPVYGDKTTVTAKIVKSDKKYTLDTSSQNELNTTLIKATEK